jgi:glucokinase
VEAAVKTVGYALLADIGGSNARFAVLEPDHAYTTPIVLQTADFSGFHTALDTFRQRADVSAPFARAAIGVAGPVTEDGASLTNCGWDLSLAAIRDAIGGGEAVLVNDFTALALSLPALVERDLRRLGGGGRPVPDAARAVLGPGTGLGVSGLVPDGRGGFVPISGEGGHVNLAASTASARDSSTYPPNACYPVPGSGRSTGFSPSWPVTRRPRFPSPRISRDWRRR